ncbi:MAG: endonuclease MutS2 [Firmicutes bacterium]|nr:endonuclease MutS2 [Bacillota bacterium]
MQAKTQATLELDKILISLTSATLTPLGAEIARKLRPSSCHGTVRAWQAQTTEARDLLAAGDEIPLRGIKDIRSALKRCRIGAALSPDELLSIKDTLRAAGQLQRFFKGKEARAPYMAKLAGGIGDFRRIIAELSRCLTEDGDIVDGASPALSRIRAGQRSCQDRIRNHLESYLRSSHWSRMLQDAIVTMRGGRFVLPVKQENKGDFPGIVHDQSASGATLFIEPASVVALNNQLRELERQEAEEIERILHELTGLVYDQVDEIEQTLAILAELDFITAKGRLSLDMKGTEPQLVSEWRLLIQRARHPLLKGHVVPIDVHLGREFTTLVITGPNTGGKTVTLKTIGLFSLMCQCGLHVPAAHCELPVFNNVFADIGDEQSIEQSLSTFSSHLLNIVGILKEAGEGSLVLLDEIGAGTDPAEGAALAMALLEEFHRRGCLTVATTHYSELKTFAYVRPGMQNASVQFDVRTLRPTFELTIGVPGQSNAFPIARRLRLPEEIIDRAQSFLADDAVKVEDLIRSLTADSRQAAADRQEAERLRREARELRDKYRDKLDALLAEKNELLADARRQALAVIRESKMKADAILGQLRAATSEAEAAALRGEIEREAELIQDLLAEEGPTYEEDDLSEPVDVAVGDRVFVQSVRQEGIVLGPPEEGSVLVQVGSMKLHAKLGDLRAIPASERKGGAAAYGSLVRGKSTTIPPEIHLRGMRAEEALDLADKYLDDALLAGLSQVRIVHGKGAGILREVIHKLLKEHPHVEDFRLGYPNEGGAGVTVATLRRS